MNKLVAAWTASLALSHIAHADDCDCDITAEYVPHVGGNVITIGVYEVGLLSPTGSPSIDVQGALQHTGTWNGTPLCDYELWSQTESGSSSALTSNMVHYLWPNLVDLDQWEYFDFDFSLSLSPPAMTAIDATGPWDLASVRALGDTACEQYLPVCIVPEGDVQALLAISTFTRNGVDYFGARYVISLEPDTSVATYDGRSFAEVKGAEIPDCHTGYQLHFGVPSSCDHYRLNPKWRQVDEVGGNSDTVAIPDVCLEEYQYYLSDAGLGYCTWSFEQVMLMKCTAPGALQGVEYQRGNTGFNVYSNGVGFFRQDSAEDFGARQLYP